MASAEAQNKGFKIRLSVKGESTKSLEITQANQVVNVTASMKFSDLKQTSFQIFGLSSEKYDVELWSGFPPKMLECVINDKNESDAGEDCLVKSIINGGENVIVKFDEKKKKVSRKRRITENNSSESKTDTSMASTSTRRSKRGIPKRAAAEVASATFKDVIREQDKLLEKVKVTRKATQSPSKLASMRKSREAAASARRLASLSGGRRLNDTTEPSSRKNTSEASSKKGPVKGMGSENDISFALLSSVNSSSKSNVSKLLRSAMRKTVEKSYEASRAVVRCSAITSSHDITFTPISKGEATCNNDGSFTVKFPKGIEGNGYFEDDVHIISIETLKAVILSVYRADDEDNDGDGLAGREMLKPTNMAQLSPRVFWSMWFHFRTKCKSVEEALILLLPELDWKFLTKRSRQLSQKAKENLIQNQEKDGSNLEESKHADEYKKGVKAIENVENAMTNMYESTHESSRERAAQAALERLKTREGKKCTWNFQTPTDQDLDELRECIIEASDNENKRLSPDQIEACVQHLASHCHMENWRMLANAQVDDLCITHLQKVIQDVDKEFLDEIINGAQVRSIDEIMLEILDGNEDIYDVLRNDAASSTPLDLTLWYFMPEVLLEEVSALNNGELKVTTREITKWCDRAKQVVESLSWLEKYATSISDHTCD